MKDNLVVQIHNWRIRALLLSVKFKVFPRLPV